MIYSSLFMCTVPEDANSIEICQIRPVKKWFGFKKVNGFVEVRINGSKDSVKCLFGTNFTNHASTLNAVEVEVRHLFGINFSDKQKLKNASD